MVDLEEIQRDLSTYLQRVQAGETLVIIQDGKPVIEMKPAVPETRTLRPFGLCAGEFRVPDNFDDPLPEYLLKDFEDQ